MQFITLYTLDLLHASKVVECCRRGPRRKDHNILQTVSCERSEDIRSRPCEQDLASPIHIE